MMLVRLVVDFANNLLAKSTKHNLICIFRIYFLKENTWFSIYILHVNFEVLYKVAVFTLVEINFGRKKMSTTIFRIGVF
jgi:hypothetical protein